MREKGLSVAVAAAAAIGTAFPAGTEPRASPGGMGQQLHRVHGSGTPHSVVGVSTQKVLAEEKNKENRQPKRQARRGPIGIRPMLRRSEPRLPLPGGMPLKRPAVSSTATRRSCAARRRSGPSSGFPAGAAAGRWERLLRPQAVTEGRSARPVGLGGGSGAMRTEVLADATQLAGQLPGWPVWRSRLGLCALPLGRHCAAVFSSHEFSSSWHLACDTRSVFHHLKSLLKVARTHDILRAVSLGSAQARATQRTLKSQEP